VLQPGESDEYRAYIMSLSQDYLADPARAIQRALQTLAVTVGQKRTPLDPNATLMYKTIALVKKHVDQHLDEDISLSAISELTGYNASYLSRIFRQHEQQSYMGFVNQKRLERISRLMRQSEMNLDEIAHTAGFHSRTYFNRFINKMTGKSPSEYRQQVNLYRQDEGD
jgi:YesN/AraC family two-component response regulator